MDQALSVYLPQDRCRALAQGVDLLEQPSGSALFADISGFTPLTETLERAWGARRGAEELARQINRVYGALIAQVDRFGGSVIGFAGDAITCWFDDADGAAGLRAVACAFALHDAMHQVAAIPLPNGTTIVLALKISVASGPARRFVVGDPAIQQIDVLAGATLARMAAGERLAQKDEVLVDQPTAAALKDAIQIHVWREDHETGERFAVVAASDNWPSTAGTVAASRDRPVTLRPEQLRPWLLPAVYERHQAGLGDFLTELRPIVTLFLRFGGIDYDGDPAAGVKLDRFVRRVQTTLTRYAGTLLQLTIGDKGSYLYAAFGAPTAHEDDPRRAARAALEWMTLTDELAIQIGISRSVLRVGAYGGPTRRTYGALGDEVNLAARLMSRAVPGEVLVSGRVHAALATVFDLEPLEPIPLKGMPEPLPVFRLLDERSQRLSEPAYTLPMVGRAAELTLLTQKLDQALAGAGQVAGIIAEAGMGKSRLVAEGIRLARRKGLRSFGGNCQSYGMKTPYLVWQPIWRAFFDLDPEMPIRRQIRAVAAAVEDWAPDRAEALPLLGPLLGLPLPENDFSRMLEPQVRKSALEALLLDCLRAAAREAGRDDSGLLFVLEDLHWIDPISHDLLELVARSIADLPVFVMLAYRPPELLRLQTPRVEALPYFTRVELAPLTSDEAVQAIRAKLAQLLPERKGAVTPTLIARIIQRAEGNPFYVEELLNYLHDRGIDPQDAAALESLDLPSSLYTLVLSRIDQLGAQQQAELKVASVIGRLFRFAWLHGAYPTLGKPELLKADLDELAHLELTPLDTPEPELTYLFKHIVTQEVAYESLSSAARASMHEQLAHFLEALDADRYLDLLAYHYEHSDNLAKKRDYLRRAGEAAAARFANVAALEYLSRALDLAPETETAERYELLLAREQIFARQADYSAQARDLAALEVLVERLDDERRAYVAARRAQHALDTDDYPSAWIVAERAVALADAAGATAIKAEGYALQGQAARQQADFAAAKACLEQALALAQEQQFLDLRAQCYRELGIIADIQGFHAEAQSLFERVLQTYRAVGNRAREGAALSNLGIVAWRLGNYTEAIHLCEQGLRIARETGDRTLEMKTLGNLGIVAEAQRNYRQADIYYEQSLRLSRTIGSRYAESRVLNMLGVSSLYQGYYTRARAYFEQSLRLAHETGDRQHEFHSLINLGRALRCIGAYAAASEYCEQALNLARAIGENELDALSHLTYLAHRRGGDATVAVMIQDVVRLIQASGDQQSQAMGRLSIGLVLYERGYAEEAARHLHEAVRLYDELNRPDLAAEPRAALARIALALGDHARAHAEAEAILPYIAEEVGGDAAEPFLIDLSCYQALLASDDARAGGVLELAIRQLQARATGIDDEALQRSFLEHVPHHRELVAAWEHKAPERKLL